MKTVIRQEEEGDIREISAIHRLAFGREDEARLVDLLRTDDAFVPELSLVAATSPGLAGHILFSKIQIINQHSRASASLALAPLGVKPVFQRQGIGGQLVARGLERARELGFRSVIVLGHEDYYPTFGFVPADAWNIKAPFETPKNAFMGLELVPGGLKNISGTVKYPKAFDLL